MKMDGIKNSDLSDREGIPPGWSSNPSAWKKRIPLIGIAFLGLLIAGYLSLYQLKIVGTIWDPFFGEGSKKILTGGISQYLPFPDALLGALGYGADLFAGTIGDTQRWRTKPWIVVFFGMIVLMLGLVSLMLMIFQPVLFNAWCTLCLASAACSIILIGPVMEEFLASLQYLKRVKTSDLPFWKIFWGTQTLG
jgi:uncharacterized membrane protein